MKKNTRERRLRSGKDWIKKYPGKNIVKGYAKQYGVDKLCAVKELRLLGVEISEEYENHLKRCIDVLVKERQKRKERREQELRSASVCDSDDYFAYIAGYTEGGFAYGITHEEMEKIMNEDK